MEKKLNGIVEQLPRKKDKKEMTSVGSNFHIFKHLNMLSKKDQKDMKQFKSQ